MKRLVICCDGTSNTPDQKDGMTVSPSNVVKLARAVRAREDEGVHQILNHGRGVGTRSGPDGRTGGAFGHGLAINVQDAYRFVVVNYEEGDQLFLPPAATVYPAHRQHGIRAGGAPIRTRSPRRGGAQVPA